MPNSSLVKDTDLQSIGTRHSKGGGSKGSETGKLLLALGLLAGAVLVIAWYQGWLPFGSSGSKPSAEEVKAKQQAFEEQQKETKRQMDSGKVRPAGTD